MGHALTARWFARIGAGAGCVLPVGYSSAGIHGVQWEGSGGLGYRGGGHVIVASAQRSVADFYGLGANATLTASLGWGWRPNGASWSIQAGGGESKLLGSQIEALGLGNNGFLANAGVYWSLHHRAAVGCNTPLLLFGNLPGSGGFGAGPAIALRPTFGALEHRLGNDSRDGPGWGRRRCAIERPGAGPRGPVP